MTMRKRRMTRRLLAAAGLTLSVGLLAACSENTGRGAGYGAAAGAASGLVYALIDGDASRIVSGAAAGAAAGATVGFISDQEQKQRAEQQTQ